MDLKETIELLITYPRLKKVAIESDKRWEFEFYEAPKETTDPTKMIFDESMPPDDVMLYAATEDIDDLMKQKKA